MGGILLFGSVWNEGVDFAASEHQLIDRLVLVVPVVDLESSLRKNADHHVDGRDEGWNRESAHPGQCVLCRALLGLGFKTEWLRLEWDGIALSFHFLTLIPNVL